MLRRNSFLAVLLTVLVLSASSLMAQPAGAGGAGGAGGGGGFGGAGGAGGRGGRGGFDPAAQLENIKTALVASDDEWKVLQPKIEKLIAANNEVQQGNRGGRGGAGGGGRGGRGGAGGGPGGAAAGGAATSAVVAALNDLRTTLENAAAPAEQITQKLTALRDARAKAAANLAAARKEVKDLLTTRQEAVLVATFSLLE